MTAPTEPLVMTLEGAILEISLQGWNISRSINREWFVQRDSRPDDEGLSDVELTGFDSWPEAVSAALGRPVVARDDAAELRAAIREWVEATDDAELFELDQSNAYGTDHADAENRVVAAVKALRAALAATEGEEA